MYLLWWSLFYVLGKRERQDGRAILSYQPMPVWHDRDRVQCKWLSFNPSSVEALSFFVPQSEGLDSADCRLESNIPLSFGTHLYYIPAFPRLSRQNTNNKKCWHITSRMLYIYLIYLCIISSASRDFLDMVYLLFEFRWILIWNIVPLTGILPAGFYGNIKTDWNAQWLHQISMSKV